MIRNRFKKVLKFDQKEDISGKRHLATLRVYYILILFSRKVYIDAEFPRLIVECPKDREITQSQKLSENYSVSGER